MRRSIFLVLGMIGSLAVSAQEKMYIHKKDGVTLGALISATDSMYFSNDRSTVYFKIGTQLAQYLVSDIDSVTFGANSNTIGVHFTGSSATVSNPLAFEGVSVAVNGADVVVTSTIADQEIDYNLSGTTSDGMFKIYSDYRYNLNLNGVNITNLDGPAINIQSEKKCTINLNAGTSNSLADGSSYAASLEDQKSTLFSEGQLEFNGTGSLSVKSNAKHAIASDDYINMKDGIISVSGAGKDGIHANDYFKMSGGNLSITATGDGIKSEAGYVQISGGNISTINTAANVNGIASDSILVISGGTINMTISGNQSKGINASQTITLSGGDITINTTGGVALVASGTGYNPAYCDGVKSDEDVTISGSKLTIKCTGAGSKGITCNKNINISSGTVNITCSGSGTTYKNASGTTDSYSAACLNADGNINITGGSLISSASGLGGKGISANGTIIFGDAVNSPTVNITTSGAKFLVSGSDYNHPKAIKSTGAITINNGTITISSSDDGIHSDASITQNNGSVTISNSVEGVESKFITINGGSMNISASDDGFNATFGTVSGGTESNDGSCLYLNGGTVVVSTTKGDAIDSNGNIVMTGGNVIVYGPTSAPEEAVDFNGTFKVSGGFLIAAGTNSNMNKAMSSSSTQNGIFATTSSGIAANTLFHIQNASGKDMVTFKMVRTSYSFLFSSPDFTNGTYSVYTGGTSTGTLSNGLYTGGTYSGGTLKKSLAISAKVTTFSF